MYAWKIDGKKWMYKSRNGVKARAIDTAIIFAVQQIMDSGEAVEAGRRFFIGKALCFIPLFIGEKWEHEITEADIESAKIPF